MMDKTETKNQLFEERSRNASQIFMGTFITMLAVGIYYTFGFYKGNQIWAFYNSNIQAFIVAIASLAGFFLVRSKQLTTAIYIYLGAFTLAIFTTTLYFGGMDILMAMILLLMYLGAASALPRKLAERTISASIFLSFLVGFTGYLDPFKRGYSAPDVVAYFFAALLIIAYGIFLYKQFRRYSLRTKLILAFVFLSTIGIGASFTVAGSNMKDTLRQNAWERLQAESAAAASTLDAFLKYSTDSIETASTYLDLRAYFILTPEARKGTQIERQVQNILYSLKNRNSDILSYGLLNLDGQNIIDSHSSNIGRSEAEFSHFKEVKANGSTYISTLLYIPGEKQSVFFISAPVYNDMGVLIGILRAKYKGSILQDILIESNENADKASSYFVLFDTSHVVLAHERLPELIGRLPVLPDNAGFAALRENYLIPSELNEETASFNLPFWEDALNQIEITPFFDADTSTLNVPITGAMTKLEDMSWVIVAVQSQEVFTLPVRRQTQIFFMLAMGTILFAIIAGSILANILAAPIQRLQTMAQRFAEGDLKAVAVIEAEDEVGSLAETFNDLTMRLRQTVESLEERIQERTLGLELRSRYLEGAAEVGRVATTFTNAEDLSRIVVDLIRDRFNLYYVGLFLADENNEWAVLQAGTGTAGEIMLANNHRLKIGEGMIGWAVKHGEVRIALDVGEDAVRFENPVLPDTRSEGALPLRSRGRVLGALTVQSTQPAAFTLEILTTLQTMADQIAVAFDNAELFAKTEASLQAERRAYGDLTLQSWHDFKTRSTGSAYRIGADGTIKPLDESAAETKHQALDADHLIQESGRAVLVPIKSRGNVIGGIRIAKNADASKWTKDQMQLVSTISEQLSVALESARLFEDAQMRAQREAVISDISSKVGASIRMDTILKTTVQELGKALSGADISFEITGPEKGAKPKE